MKKPSLVEDNSWRTNIPAAEDDLQAPLSGAYRRFIIIIRGAVGLGMGTQSGARALQSYEVEKLEKQADKTARNYHKKWSDYHVRVMWASIAAGGREFLRSVTQRILQDPCLSCHLLVHLHGLRFSCMLTVDGN